jgi:hypothetical protein
VLRYPNLGRVVGSHVYHDDPAIIGPAAKKCNLEVSLFHRNTLVRLVSKLSRTLARADQTCMNVEVATSSVDHALAF